MVKSAEKDYTKALKEYIGEFFIDSEKLDEYVINDHYRSKLAIDREESFKSENHNLILALLFRHLPCFIELGLYDLDDLLTGDGELCIGETIQMSGYTKNISIYKYRSFEFWINKKLIFDFLTKYIGILNKKPIFYNAMQTRKYLPELEDYDSKYEVNYKLIKSARKGHYCSACDATYDKRKYSRDEELDKLFNKLKVAGTDYAPLKGVLDAFEKKHIFHQIKNTEGQLIINKGLPYILYSRDNFDMWYAGEYSKLCLHCFLYGSMQFYHAFNVYCLKYV